MVKNQPANAGDTGSVPGLRRFHLTRGNKPRVPQLPSLHSTTRRATRKPPQWEAHSLQWRLAPANLRKPSHSNKDPTQHTHTPKNSSPYLKLQLLLTLMTSKTVTHTLFLNCRCHLTNPQSLLKPAKHVECDTCETELAIFIFFCVFLLSPTLSKVHRHQKSNL